LNEQTHIIDKVFLEVNTSSQKTAFIIKDNVSSFLESELFPKLERLLEKYDVQESIIRFDELRLDVTIDKWENQEELKAEILELIGKKIQATVDFNLNGNSEVLSERSKEKFISQNRKLEAVFLCFLENGRLPWYGREDDIMEISRKEKWDEYLENKQFVYELTRLFTTDKYSLRRFVLQFPESYVFDFLQKNNPKLGRKEITNLRQLANQSIDDQKLFLQWLVKFVIRENELIKKIHLQELQHLFPGKKELSANKLKKLQTGIVPILKKLHPEFLKDEDWNSIFKFSNDESISLKTKETSDSASDSGELFQLKDEGENEVELEIDDEFFVGNAGLILLHPFLKSFFDEFQFLDERGQILNYRKESAVQALHFLATGSEDFFEGNLTFEKFLCNVPLKWPVSRESRLDEQIKTEAEMLLKAAIKHWGALKNTSPDGLRQNFLQRSGKLITKEGKFRLLVERKTQDILLERLSWSISVVKLPWMKNLLHVEW